MSTQHILAMAFLLLVPVPVIVIACCVGAKLTDEEIRENQRELEADRAMLDELLKDRGKNKEAQS